MKKSILNLFNTVLLISAVFISCNGLNGVPLDNPVNNNEIQSATANDYIEITSQPDDLNSVFLYETESSKLPELSVSVQLKKSGKLSFEWYKKSSDGNGIKVYETESIEVDDLDKVFSNNYRVPLGDFAGNNLLNNVYYCKIIFGDNENIFYLNTSDSIVKSVLPETGLKTLYVTTENGVFPPCEYLLDEIKKYITVGQEKIPGKLVIEQNGNILYDSGEYEKKKSGITIKIRGNGSAYADKKPFKIKLQKKEDLLFRGDSKYKDKNWNLLGKADSFDTAFGLTVSDIIYESWTPKFEYVNVVLNDEYLGVYILVESIEENSDCRIDVASDGFCVERDACVFYENQYETPENQAVIFRTAYKDLVYSFIYPDDEDLKDKDVEYVKSCLDNLEDSIKKGTYDTVIDTKSWASWILVHEIVGQRDVNGANKYVSKYSRSDSDLLKMETTWDFDQILSNSDKWLSLHDKDTAFYYADLFNSQNKAFVDAYKDLWTEIEPSLNQKVNDWLSIFNSEFGKAINEAYKLDNARWKYTALPTVERNSERISSWMEKRVQFIKENINSL